MNGHCLNELINLIIFKAGRERFIPIKVKGKECHTVVVFLELKVILLQMDILRTFYDFALKVVKYTAIVWHLDKLFEEDPLVVFMSIVVAVILILSLQESFLEGAFKRCLWLN